MIHSSSIARSTPGVHQTGRACCAAILALATCTASGAEYYVSPLGNDSNPGSLAAPFATIQKATNTVVAGDTCYIRGGTYHEAVVKYNLTGTADKPITFVNYGGEEVILDGTQPITDLGSSGWTQHSGSIYRCTLTSNVWQLFVNGEQMIPARWPNARFDDETVWDSLTHWGRGGTDDTNGTMVDHAHNGISLVSSGLDITGAIAILNLGNWATWALPVLSHSAGTDTFTYAPISSGYQKFSNNNHRYFIEGKLALLDAEKEWFFDTSTKALYLWAPGGAIPSGNIRGKVLTYAFDLSSSNYITIRGLHFFGSTFKTYQCTQVTVEDCELLYPSCSKRMLGETGDAYPTSFDTNGSTKPSSCTIRNCVLAYIDGPAIHLRGMNNLVENCLIHHVDWSTVDFRGGGFTIHAIQATSTTFRRNTMHTAGVAEGYRSGNSLSGVYPDLVEFNDIYNMSLTQTDGSAIDIGSTGVQGCIVRYNWSHNNDKAGIRFDATETNIYGIQGMQHHNVVWATIFQMVKGDDHKVFNNTCFGNGPPDLIIYDKAGAGGINDLTVTRNNVAGSIENSSSGPFDGSFPGTHDHNFTGDVATQLRDFSNRDFRPRAGSVLIDTGVTEPGLTDGYIGSAPDQGAYEYGDTSYWIPGYQCAKASQPIPPDGATYQPVERDLIWLGGYKGTAYDVFFGTNQAAVAAATTTSPEYMGRQSNNIHAPTQVIDNTTYYWRVDTLTPTGTVTGDVWHFTMAQHNAAPVATAQNVSTPEDTARTITLAGTDVDLNTLSYTVVTQPAHGTLSGTAPNVTYSPSTNYFGPDNFTFKVNDGTVDSAPATVTITVTPSTTLPWPWATTDIGSGMLAGSVSYNSATGTFTQSGSGTILINVSPITDTLRFTYQILSGDGGIITKIPVFQDSGSSSRVGVMLRESLATGSKFVLSGLTGSNAYRWSRRTVTDAKQTSTNYGTGTAPNIWVRLLRVGGTITGYTSPDGSTWTLTGTSTMTLPTNVYIGLAVNSGSDTTLNTSQFSNVTVSGTIISPLGTYSSWAFSNIVTGGEAGDADHDGLSNLDEYTLGTDPHISNLTLLALAPAAANSITLTFLARAATGTGYEGLTRKYDVQVSADLASWQNLSGYSGIIGADQSVVVTLPVAQSRKFYRLSARLE
ncbi:MAG: Ig-like domain-containing protein [Verrucomicrobiota bacterium]